MALLNFPDNPIPNQLYPDPCPVGVTQYRWDIGSGIWRIVGVATGVAPGTYGNSITVPRINVDVQGVITQAENVPIRAAGIGISGISALNDTTSSASISEALTARAGKYLQDQIGNLGVCIVPRRNNVVEALNYLQGEISRLEVENLAWCGYYNALEGFISFVSAAGAALGYQLGQELPAPEPINSGNFFIVNVPGNPYIGGDRNAPDALCRIGDWIIQDRVKWVRVNTGSEVSAKDVAFDSRGSCFTATNVQSALTQVCAYFRTPIGGATISELKPDNPYQGQLWWDSNDGYFYIYYRDGLGAQWIEVGGGGSEGLQGGTGTVYEINTGIGLTGGPINTEGTISLVPATTSTIGGVYVPNSFGLDLRKDGKLSLLPATDETLGGVIIGEGLNIDSSGVLSLKAGTPTTADDVSVRRISGISTADTVQEALESIEIQVQDRIESAVVLDEGLTAVVTPAVFTSNDGTTLQLTPTRGQVGKIGVLALTNDVTGNSESLGLSQKAGAYLQGEVQALIGVNTLAGTYDASTGRMLFVTPAGSLKGFAPNQPPPPAIPSIDNYYIIVTVGGNIPPPGGQSPAGPYDWYIVEADSGTNTWFLIDFPSYTVDAASVVLGPIPGLSATNVQTGIAEVQANAQSRTKDIVSAAGLSVTYNAARNCQIDLIAASPENLGGVYVVPNRGLILGEDGGLSLAPPTEFQIGGVKAGDNITISPDGTISARDQGGGGKADTVEVDPPIPGIPSAGNVQRALEALELQTQDRVEYILPEGQGINVRQTDPVRDSYDGTTAYISVDSSSTGRPGIVQLTNDITGSSETLAPTQRSISILNSKVDALTGANVLAGTYNCASGTVVTVTPAGQKAGFIVDQQAPLSKNVPDNYYLIVVTGGSFGPPGAIIPPGGVQPGDWFIAENQSGIAEPAWVTIDYDQRTVAAQNVSVSPIPGLAATNAQSAFTELTSDLAQTITSAESSNNGISVRLSNSGLASFGQRLGITLNPANASDIGGVIVLPNNGLDVYSTGQLVVSAATRSTIGGVKIGSGINVEPDGTISVSDAPTPDSVTIKILDDISPQFDGSNIVFVLTVNGNQLPSSVTTATLFLDVGGISQPPNSAYVFNPANSTVTFTGAPPAAATFSGRVLLNVVG